MGFWYTDGMQQEASAIQPSSEKLATDTRERQLSWRKDYKALSEDNVIMEKEGEKVVRIYGKR